MAVLTTQSARVYDPVLSNIALGYMHPDHVGLTLFPRADVGARGGQVIEFGKESFRLYNARRAPGAATKRVQFGYAGKPFALVQDALEGQVPREILADAAAVPHIDLGARSVNTVMATLSLALEAEQATLATTPANYDSDHKIDLTAAKWATGDPTGDIETGREAIRASVGIYPNTLLLAAKAFAAVKQNANVIDRFKYTSAASITTDMLQNLWDLTTVAVGKAISFDDAGASTDLWGVNAVLAYVPPGPSNVEQPSFGYTYTLLGNPMVEPAYFDQNPKSWIYPVTYERVPVLSGITSGYLMYNVA